MFISNNPSVMKSQKWLADALCLLMENHEFDKIQITDIAKTADVSRQTFYKNFTSKEDVLLYQTQRILTVFFSESLSDNYDMTLICSTFFKFCLTEKSYFTLLHHHQKMHLLNTVITQSIIELLDTLGVVKGYEDEDIRYAVSFLVGALVQLVDLWISEGYQKSIDDLTKVMINLLSGCAFDSINQTLSFKNKKNSLG